jgi:hypothetical protein
LQSFSGFAVMYGVSCPTANDCLVVGNQTASGHYGGVLRSTDGGLTWTLIHDLPSDIYFSGVDCLSGQQNCYFVGQNGLAPYIDFSSDLGTTLTPQTLPYTTGILSHVSCSTASDCVAVDSYDHNTAILTTHSGGGTWTQTMTTSSPATAQMSGISCPSVLVCVAIGHNAATTEVWGSTDGGDTWAARTLPNTVTQVFGVGCSSAAFCMLGGVDTIVTTDAGASWQEFSLAPNSELDAFSCWAVDECMGGGLSMSSWSVRVATSVHGTVSPIYGLPSVKAIFNGSVSAASSGLPTGQLQALLGTNVRCSVELSGAVGACTASNAGVGQTTYSLAYVGNDLYAPSSVVVHQTIGTGPTCKKLMVSSSKVMTFSKCTHASAGYTTITAKTAALSAPGVFKWHSSGKTFKTSLTSKLEGKGSCASGFTEILVTGTVLKGGTSKTPKTGDGIGMQICMSAKSASLAPLTFAIF